MSESDPHLLLRKKVQELTALLDFGRAVAGLVSPEEILRRLALTVAGQWVLRTYGIAVFREGRQPLVRQRGFALLSGGPLPLDGPDGVLSAIGHEPVVLSPAAPPADGVLGALASAGARAVVPLVSAGTTSGLVALGERPGGLPWGEDDLAHVAGLGTQALVALEAAWQREEALTWRRLGEAREEWRRLDPLAVLVFASLSRLGPRVVSSREELLDLVVPLLSAVGVESDRRRLASALDRLVAEGALEPPSRGLLALTKPDWLLLPEVRGPLAALARSTRRQVGGFELLERIGAGGMAEVFRARSLADGTEAAVKLISEDRTEDPTMRERFEREGAIVARLVHPHIVRLLARGEQEGRLYLAMELVPGEPVSRAIGREPFPLREALRGLAQVGSALAALHAAGVVHRDVKTSNVMRRPDGGFVLLDFGLARDLDSRSLTRSGEVVGTVAYLAPEVLRGGPAEPASDVWALGIAFLEMLSGRRPWRNVEGFALAVEVLDSRPEIPPALAEASAGAVLRLVEGMLAHDPAHRIADGSALLDALSRVGGPGEVRPS